MEMPNVRIVEAQVLRLMKIDSTNPFPPRPALTLPEETACAPDPPPHTPVFNQLKIVIKPPIATLQLARHSLQSFPVSPRVLEAAGSGVRGGRTRDAA